MDTLVNIFPSNFISPMAEANMLQVIVMALILGFAIILVGEKNVRVVNAFNDLNEIFMKCMEMILKLSPIGVFCLLCPVIAANGPAIIGSLMRGVIAIVLCAIVLSRILGMNGVWLSFLASEMLTFVVILILSRKKESVSNDYI